MDDNEKSKFSNIIRKRNEIIKKYNEDNWIK